MKPKISEFDASDYALLVLGFIVLLAEFKLKSAKELSHVSIDQFIDKRYEVALNENYN